MAVSAARILRAASSRFLSRYNINFDLNRQKLAQPIPASRKLWFGHLGCTDYRVICSIRFHQAVFPTGFSRYSQLSTSRNVRRLSTEALTSDQLREELEVINAHFAEARDEIDMAMESKETVYYNEECDAAKAAVKLVLDRYNALLTRLEEKERQAIQRSMGMKMEQLKGEMKQLEE